MGYSPVRGRLHTRYAPVRRSPGPEGPIPLDLHVLGLPLAFILSQDQTLHRCIFVSLQRPKSDPGNQNGLFSCLCRSNMSMNFV